MEEYFLEKDTGLTVKFLSTEENKEIKLLYVYYWTYHHVRQLQKNSIVLSPKNTVDDSKTPSEMKECHFLVLIDFMNYDLLIGNSDTPISKGSKQILFKQNMAKWIFESEGKVIEVPETNRLHRELNKKGEERKSAIIEFLSLCLLNKEKSKHIEFYGMDELKSLQSFSLPELKSRINSDRKKALVEAISLLGDETFTNKTIDFISKFIKLIQNIKIKKHVEELIEKDIESGLFGSEIKDVKSFAGKFGIEEKTFKAYFKTNSISLEFISKLKEVYPIIDLNKYIIPKTKGFSFYSDGPFVTVINFPDESDRELNLGLEWNTVSYFKEKEPKKDSNPFLRELEGRKGRYYFSNIFPSGLHRPERTGEDKERNSIFKDKSLMNEEIYTLASFLHFAFGMVGDRIYSLDEKLEIMKNANDYFNTQASEFKQLNEIERKQIEAEIELKKERFIHFLDTSKKEDSHFYGYATIRLLDDDYIVSTEPYRGLRIERNNYRYNTLKEKFENKKNMIEGKHFLRVMMQTLEEWKANSKNMDNLKAIKLFINKLNPNEEYIKACRNNLSEDI
ncbi:MAG: hypothetical protein H7A25_06310 [Leptospiraceae bacterium]|nr:hypothetical protein [Leptospiraceae bacterium]